MNAQLNARCIILAAMTLLVAMTAAHAQNYPAKAIRIVVPYTPGGPTDILARMAAQRFTEAWGQPAIIENRPGAAGMTGTAFVAKASPDGYTLCTAGITFATVPLIDTKLPFDAMRDFAPITLMGAVPNIAVVHPSVPVKSIKELIAFGKSRPGQLLYASGGAGGTQHLAGEMFAYMTGLNMQHVGYRGSAPSMTAIISGEVSMGFTDMMISAPHVRSGKLRGLAVTGAKRSSVVPELPSVSEAGLPGYAVSAWFGLVAPAGTPRDIVNRLQSEVSAMLKQPATVERLSSMGAELSGNTPDEFGAFLRSERDKWARVIKAAGIKAE